MEKKIEIRSLEKILFPEDKSKCFHIILDKDFFVKTKDGCIMKCANCGKKVAYTCDKCGVGETLRHKKSGQLITVLPCDGMELKASGEYE